MSNGHGLFFIDDHSWTFMGIRVFDFLRIRAIFAELITLFLDMLISIK